MSDVAADPLTTESMPAQDVERTFMQAAESGRLVRLSEEDGQTRLVEPYMVYLTSAGRRLLHMYQLEGYSAHGHPRDWKNAEPSRFIGAVVESQPYSPRPDYNPFNEKQFPFVVYAASNASGERRPPNVESS
jgi:hypothetical protein